MDITDRFEIATVKVCNYLKNNPGSEITLYRHSNGHNLKFRSNKNDFEVYFSSAEVSLSKSLAGSMVRTHGMGFIVDLLSHGHMINLYSIRNCNLCMIQEIMSF